MFEGKWIEVDEDGIGWAMELRRIGSGSVFEHEHTYSQQLPIVIRNFICRLCGSEQFKPLYHSSGSGLGGGLGAHTIIGPGLNRGRPTQIIQTIVGYRCCYCTTRFDDPAKFSKNQPPEIVPPEPTPTPLEQYKQKLNDELTQHSPIIAEALANLRPD
jgi:hypothetical protein